MLSPTKEDIVSQTVDRKMLRSWSEQLEAVGDRLSDHFARSEVRQRAREYLHGLLSEAERKNSWQLAEVAGNATPYGIQHLLGRANWDADAVRDDLREYVIEHLADAKSSLIVDETGFIKKGISMKMSSCRWGLEGGPVAQHRPQDVDPASRPRDQGLGVLLALTALAVVEGSRVRRGAQAGKGRLVEDPFEDLVA